MIRNVGLTSALNLYRAGLQLGLNIALAHFLTPSDFGQVALVLPITLFILLIGDFGITGAIVSSSASAREAGAAATICQGFGLLMPVAGLLLYAVGGLNFMQHSTAELLLAFSLVAMLAMMAVVPRAMLERSLRYGQLTVVETLASTTAFIASVTSAAYGLGVWSFVCYHLTMQALRSAYFWYATRRDIDRNLHVSLAAPLMRFGGWVVAFNLVNYLMRNLDNYMVGGWMGTSSLGLYALAYQVMLVPMMVVSWPVSGVLLSTLSRIRGRPDMQRDAFFAVLMLASCATFPMMTFVALKAELIFGTILPTRWAMIGPVTAFLAIAGGLQSATALLGALFMVSGRVRTQFWFGLCATTLTLTTLAVAAYSTRSLTAMAAAYAVLAVFMSIGYFAMMARMLGTGLRQVAIALLPAIGLSVGAGATMLLVDRIVIHQPNVLRLIVDAAVFGGVIGAALLIRRANLMKLFATLQRTGQAAGAVNHSA
ncbi:polysaccharide biosynthesis family protein [Novosphingobium sp. Rr 2-17]|uniref:oligosaccharide flippase family protein n=1 Tax=Novosphingobium sp. Rr 2-17 TaxID=555793 RepID=UPI0002697AE7|nr:oligosaccharide flippase family protein [Novosphingobium sp. Rr 2-17]EIZ81183.1 polysaccharide biosynthesis family protein [Novosphingobium sp. Rr 2-17]